MQQLDAGREITNLLLYTAGPFRGDVKKNVQAAKDVAADLWQAGHCVICPHSNTDGLIPSENLSLDFWIEGDLNMLSRCDGVVLLPNWEKSEGARIEKEYADSIGVPCWVYPDVPPLHPTEVLRPVQVKAFREILGRMYRTHLSKNADYSPANVLATGEIGLVTRLWDKTARLLNLVGFRIEVASSRYEAPAAPNHESIEDTYQDLCVYGVIGLLLRQGKWGR